jgi:hypothetical protein
MGGLFFIGVWRAGSVLDVYFSRFCYRFSARMLISAYICARKQAENWLKQGLG